MRYFRFTMLFVITFFSFCEEYYAQDAPPSLYESLFYNEFPEYSPTRLDVSLFPKDVRERLKIYKARAASFKSKLKPPGKTAFPEVKMGFYKSIQLEKGIVLLIEAEGIEELAAAYARQATIYLEYEGSSEGPLEEAQFAENYLIVNPRTILRPYLVLFLLYRYRYAFECLGQEKNVWQQIQTAEKYQMYLKLARADKDPLVNLIAEDIDKQDYVYLDIGKRP